MSDWIIFGWMVTFGVAYALFLQVADEKLGLVSRETWVTVVVGVSATLGLLGLFAIENTLEYWKVWAGFGCTGGPVVMRSLVNRFVDGLRDRQERMANASPRE